MKNKSTNVKVFLVIRKYLHHSLSATSSLRFLRSKSPDLHILILRTDFILLLLNSSGVRGGEGHLLPRAALRLHGAIDINPLRGYFPLHFSPLQPSARRSVFRYVGVEASLRTCTPTLSVTSTLRWIKSKSPDLQILIL